MRTAVPHLVIACVLAAGVVAAPVAQRGPQQPPMVKEGVTEKISDHVYVIPDGNVGLVPNIAIIDWRDASTYNEFLLFEEYFESRGCRVRIASPENLDYREGRLWIEDFGVDLVYKRVVVGEFLQKFGTNHALIDAVRDHSVCMVNGFTVQMLTKKAIFALLSDPDYANLFDADQTKAISGHIPWTRKVRECKTVYGNRSVDLVPFVSENRDHLVLKPNGEYGGRGVVLGWECDADRWDQTLKGALDGSYVVQERVPQYREFYPSIVDGELRIEERFFDLDPYIWHGDHAEGCGVRLSRAALLNVAGGGSATPMFVIRKKQ